MPFSRTTSNMAFWGIIVSVTRIESPMATDGRRSTGMGRSAKAGEASGG